MRRGSFGDPSHEPKPRHQPPREAACAPSVRGADSKPVAQAKGFDSLTRHSMARVSDAFPTVAQLLGVTERAYQHSETLREAARIIESAPRQSTLTLLGDSAPEPARGWCRACGMPQAPVLPGLVGEHEAGCVVLRLREESHRLLRPLAHRAGKRRQAPAPP